MAGEVYSKRVRAGKRTYFFDIKATRNNDFYLTITESKRSGMDESQFVKHKIYLYKEDFHKFIAGLNETVEHVKTDLLPEYDFDQYDRERTYGDEDSEDEKA